MAVKKTIRLSKLALSVFGLLVAIFTLEFLLRVNLVHESANSIDSNITDESIYESDSYLGWKGKPNVNLEGTFQSKKIKIETNTEGFRDDDFIKFNDTKRIVFLGDSFVWGWGIEKEGRFDELLQSKLGQSWQVFNLGMNGYSSDQEIILYDQYNSQLAPNVVVLIFFANDLNDNLAAAAYSKPKPLFVKNNGVYKIIPPAANDNDKRNVTGLSSNIKSKFSKNLYSTRIVGGFLINNQVSAEILKKLGIVELTPHEKIQFSSDLINYFTNVVRDNDQKLIVVTIPHRKGYETISFNQLFKKFEDELVNRFNYQRDVLVLRLFSQGSDTESYYLPWPDIHLNDRGHELLSQKLYQVIQDWE